MTKDILGRLIDYESGYLDSEEELDLFQDLVDTGYIEHLQGNYQRTAQALVESGSIHV